MSLWLDSAIRTLYNGEYKHFREGLLPIAPIEIPQCMLREVDFAERCCLNNEKDWIFPLRFLWLLDANEQRLFGYKPSKRSIYHPEKILEAWNRVSTDSQYRKQFEDQGIQFNFDGKAIHTVDGWIYIGERYVEDFLEIESALGVEILFSNSSDDDCAPAFLSYKKSQPFVDQPIVTEGKKITSIEIKHTLGSQLPVDQISENKVCIYRTGIVKIYLYSGLSKTLTEKYEDKVDKTAINNFFELLNSKIKVQEWNSDYSVDVRDGFGYEYKIRYSDRTIKKVIGTIKLPPREEQLSSEINKLIYRH